MKRSSLALGDAFLLCGLFVWVAMKVGPWWLGAVLLVIGFGLNAWEFNRKNQ